MLVFLDGWISLSQERVCICVLILKELEMRYGAEYPRIPNFPYERSLDYWRLETGYWTLGTGYGKLDAGCWMLNAGF